MPASVFALSRAPTTRGCYGLAAAAAPILPVQFRQASSVSDNNIVTLSSTPLTGSLIVVAGYANTDTAGTPTITGFGVDTWTRHVAHAVGGANNTAQAVWTGIVGQTPSTSATIQANWVATTAVEFTGVATGTARDTKSSTGNSGTTATAALLRSSSAGGIVLACIGGFGTPSYPSGLTTAVTGTGNGRFSGIFYGAAAYQANTPITTSASSTDKTLILTAIIA